MKNKDLQEFLKQHPDDMEVVVMGDSYTYEAELDLEVEDALLNSVPEDKNRIYFKEDYDGYWTFQYTPTKVLLIY
jgi:hypothetical protein